MAQELKTFKDIHDYVVEEANLNSSDSTASNRINRLINMTNNDIAIRHRWRWLERSTSTVVPAVHKPGSITISNGEATVVGNATVAFAASLVGRKIQFTTDQSVTEIASVVSATRLTLTATYRGDDISSGGYRIYQDEYSLPVTADEAIDVYHYQSPLSRRPTLKPITRRQMHNYSLRFHSHEHYAVHWTHDQSTTSGTRKVRIWPPGFTQDYRLEIDYTRTVNSLSATGDEPLMPVNYRSVLAYGALEQEFIQQGIVQRAGWAKGMYNQKLENMRDDWETTDRRPRLLPVWKQGRTRVVTTGRFDLGPYFDTDTYKDDY